GQRTARSHRTRIKRTHSSEVSSAMNDLVSPPLGTGLHEPVRNRWFFGKLLEAYHMQLETDAGNYKRWLINRLVHGSGISLGLDVAKNPNADAPAPLKLYVTPGLAIDWWGREIIVPQRTAAPEITKDMIVRAQGSTNDKDAKAVGIQV